MVHYGADDFADLGLADLFRDLLLELHRLFVARLFDLGGELAFHFTCATAFFLTVGEDAEALEPCALDEVEEVFKFFLRLAGESDDERGADGDSGDAFADALHEGLDVLAGSLAFHHFEHPGVDVLEGHINVSRDVAGGGDAVDEFIAPVRGVGVK